MGLPTIDHRDFYNDLLHALYTEFPGGSRAGLAVRPRLSQEEREALEMEALSYATIRGPRDGRMFCYDPQSVEEMDPLRIKAYRRIAGLLPPEWAERVRLATLMENELGKVVYLSGVPPYPAVALIQNMLDRGELRYEP